MESNQTVAPVKTFPKTSSGLDENVASLLCYLFSWVSGLIFLLIEKENKVVRFHAWQSIALAVVSVAAYIVIFILAFIPVLGIIFGCIGFVVPLLVLVASIILMIKAYQGEKYKLPIIGDFVEKNLMK
jgi:uncharacterized membrane protein